MEAEFHPKQFRGVTVPADVFGYLERGQINGSELALLVVIDSLVSEERGCFASNAYLAGKVGLSTVRVSANIRKLRGLGLVREVGFDGRKRYLETAFSRSNIGASLKTTRQTRRKQGGSRIENNLQREESENTHSQPPNGGDCGEVDVSFGLTKPKPSKTPVADADRADAKQLRDALAAKRKLSATPNREAWARRFAALRAAVGDARLTSALRWYCANVGKPYVPQAFCAESFQKKFVAIEAAMARGGLRLKLPAWAGVATRHSCRPQPKPACPRLTHGVGASGLTAAPACAGLLTPCSRV